MLGAVGRWQPQTGTAGIARRLLSAPEFTTATQLRSERAEANPAGATVRRIAQCVEVTMVEVGAAAGSGD